MSIFQPPVVRSTTLNRALFTRTYNLAAARVHDVKNIARYRKELSKTQELLGLERLSPIVNDPDSSLAAKGRKCLLLRPEVSPSVPDTWGKVLREGVEKNELGVVPYELTLDYDFWGSRDILKAVLPEEMSDDIQSSFNTAGHVAHLNLRSHSLPYKHILAEVLADKNANIKTVINKIDDVGTASQFRTFQYEVLTGPDDLNVEVKENACTFRFDYAKVYWNSKLEPEHTRLINLFQPGEVVCDVMAGIGPFAVPAGKRGVFVWANDFNPESYHYLDEAIKTNKVSQFVRPFNQDGKVFIKHAAESVLKASTAGETAVVHPKVSRSAKKDNQPPPKHIPIPPTISHFVMNLPASAITFLPSFKGVYAGQESLFAPATSTKLPLVHVHCFAVKRDDEVPKLDICERISHELGVQMRLGDAENDGEVTVHPVRVVAPNKSMFCATFRVPPEVAFATSG